MAYEPIASSDESFEDVIFDEALNDFGDSYSEFDMINSLNFSESDDIFIGLDNVPVNCQETVEPHAVCTHSMVDGNFYTHSKNSSGGCTIKIYTCQRCEKCGYRANAVYQYKIVYPTCPH